MIPVHLHHIPADGTLSLVGEVAVADLGPFGFEEAGVKPLGPLRYQLEVGLSEGGLFATGTVALLVRAACVSCLEPFEYEVATYEFAMQKELVGSELVDLTPEVREDIHLLLPMHPRCALGGNKCPAQFPQRVVPSSKNSEVRSVWAALDNITHL